MINKLFYLVSVICFYSHGGIDSTINQLREKRNECGGLLLPWLHQLNISDFERGAFCKFQSGELIFGDNDIIENDNFSSALIDSCNSLASQYSIYSLKCFPYFDEKRDDFVCPFSLCKKVDFFKFLFTKLDISASLFQKISREYLCNVEEIRINQAHEIDSFSNIFEHSKNAPNLRKLSLMQKIDCDPDYEVENKNLILVFDHIALQILPKIKALQCLCLNLTNVIFPIKISCYTRIFFENAFASNLDNIFENFERVDCFYMDDSGYSTIKGESNFDKIKVLKQQPNPFFHIFEMKFFPL